MRASTAVLLLAAFVAAGAPARAQDQDPPPQDPAAFRTRVVVTRSDGTPAAGAQVAASGEWASGCIHASQEFGRAAADKDGAVTLDSGEHRFTMVRVWAYDGASAVMSSLIEPGTDAAKVCRLVLADGVPMKSRVVGADDAPVAGAEVRIHVGWPYFRLTAKSAADGTVAFPPVPKGAEGRVGVYADVPGFVDHFEETDDLSLPARIVLHPAVTVRGRAFDGDGIARGKTWIGFHGIRGEFLDALETDADGRFERALYPTAAIYVTMDGHVPFRVPGDVTKPRRVDLGDLHLARGGTLRGVVVNADGTPAAKARVFAFAVTLGFVPNEAWADDEGRFTAVGLPDGEIRVSAVASEWRATPEDPAHRSGEIAGLRAGATDVKITLPK